MIAADGTVQPIESLLGMPLETFLDEYWEKKHLRVRHDPSFFDRVMSFADVDRCIASARTTQGSGILVVVPPPGSDRPRGQHSPHNAKLHDLYRAFAGGDTLRLTGIQGFWPAASAIAGALGETFSGSVGVNAYLTPANSQAFPAHFDTHDVFVLQVDGSKEWWIYEGEHGLPTSTLGHVKDLTSREATKLDESTATIKEQFRIEKGDFLYIPRGIPHKAVATDDPSLHLTFGLRPTLWYQVLRRAVDFAATHEQDLRKAVPPGFQRGSGSDEELEAAFREVLAKAWDSLEAGPALRSMAAEVVKQHEYPADGHFVSLNRVADLTPDSTLSRRRGLDCVVEAREQGARVRYADNEITGPGSIGPALVFIRDHDTFKVSDLPGPLDEASKVVLARKLVKEGLLRIG